MKVKKSAFTVVIPYITMLSASNIVLAQSAGENSQGFSLEEVVVTATRRSERIQDIPISVSSLQGDGLREKGISDPRQLSSIAPGLYVDQGQGIGHTHVSIRGLASTDFSVGVGSPVATYLNDVYQPFARGLGTQIYDVNRIEVLRGPQGTLFGKNTTGGALSYYFNAPEFSDEGYITLSAAGGQYDRYGIEGVINKEITDDVAGRVSFKTDTRSDYIENRFPGGADQGEYENYNLRAQMLWDISERTSLNVTMYGMEHNGDGPNYNAEIHKSEEEACDFFVFGAYLCDFEGNLNASPKDSDETYANSTTAEDFNSYGIIARVEHEVGAYQITSITSFQQGEYIVRSNDDGLPTDFFHSRQASETYQYHQEFRIATPVENSIRSVVGLFYQFDNIDSWQGSISNGGIFDYIQTGSAEQDTSSIALFSSTTFDVAESISVVVGLRYTYEDKEIENTLFLTGEEFDEFGNLVLDLEIDEIDVDLERALAKFSSIGYLELDEDDATWEEINWDVAVNWNFKDDGMVYAKVGTGFRSGGWQVGTTNPNALKRVSPEEIISYELGAKTEWFDNRLRINLSVYDMQYTDLQTQIANDDGSGLILDNASDASISGVEVEVQALMSESLLVRGSIGYTDATYENYAVDTEIVGARDYSGNSLPYAPEVTANLGLSYDLMLDQFSVTLLTDWSYRSKVYFDQNNYDEVGDESRILGDARVIIRDQNEKHTLSFYVNNLTDEEVRAFSFGLEGPEGVIFAPTIYAPKRTWGVEYTYNF